MTESVVEVNNDSKVIEEDDGKLNDSQLKSCVVAELASSSTSSEDDLMDHSPLTQSKQPVYPDRQTFAELLEHCRRHRVKTSQISGATTFSNFTMARRTGSVVRLYAIGRVSSDTVENTLLYADLQPSSMEAEGQQEPPKTAIWKPSIEDEKDFDASKNSVSKDEELLRQRLRQLVGGVGSYDFNPEHSTFMYSTHSRLYLLSDDEKSKHPIVEELDVKSCKANGSSPMDAKFCPCNPSFRAFVLNNDLYLSHENNVTQLTRTGELKNSVKSAGVASYIVQEEFNRYTGYWWCPKICDGKYYILYEENDASDVEVFSISCPVELANSVEMMRYPRPGKFNVRWSIKMVEISPERTSPEPSVKNVSSKVLRCAFDLRSVFPWAEYLIRAGWTPDAKGVWLQLLSRLQRKLALLYVPVTAFVGESVGDTTDFSLSQLVVLYEEETPDLLIKDHHYLTFVKPVIENRMDDNSNLSFNFIWCHNKLGYTHLYIIHSYLVNPIANSVAFGGGGGGGGSSNCSLFSFCRWNETPLTRGEFEVCRKAEPYVDESRGLIYFLANKDDPLEMHLYCMDYLHPALGMKRLTQLNFSYGLPRDQKAFHLADDDLNPLLVISRSNLLVPTETLVYHLTFSSTDNGCLPSATLLYQIVSNDQLSSHLSSPTSSPKFKERKLDHESEPEIYFWRDGADGKIRYGCLWRPLNFDDNKIYPTVLYVYGGPEVQLIRNAYMRNMNFSKFTSIGYAVVCVDGRGSANRGMGFEQDMWGNMGSVELDDQIQGLKYIGHESKCLDLSRVAIIGWSYGGYMALMGLAKFGNFFKVAVAGAPVTVWEFYDTGYTERYMGLPDKCEQAYQRSSVLSYVRQFPDEQGRLLLLHGIMDENVHFQHTSALINALIRAGKPYQLQIYPSERHAMGSFDACVHMEATILDFLHKNL